MSPTFLFGLIWTFIILLQSLCILNFYVEVNYVFLLIQMSIFIVMALIELNFSPNKLKIFRYDFKAISDLNFSLRKILISMFIIDLIYSNGVPLFWILTGDSKTHVDFGMPTFHGIFHGLLLYFSISSWILCNLNIDRKNNVINIILLLLYAFFSFNRGIVIIFLFQAFFYSLFINSKKRYSLYILGFIICIPIIYLFGILGDLRMGENVFEKSISNEWLDLFEVVPASFLWFYAYATGGLNNLYYNIDSLQPNYLPFYTFTNMVPTIIYDFLGVAKGDPSFILADGRLTVSTAYQGFVSDFGYLGVFIYLPILISTIINYKYFKLGDFKSGIIYCMLMQTIIMTPYIDTFFYLTFLFQIIFALIVFNRFKFHEAS